VEKMTVENFAVGIAKNKYT